MGELSDIRVIRDIEAKNNCKHHKRALSLAIALDRLRLGKTNLSKLNLLLHSFALSLAIALDRLRLGKTNLSKLNLLLHSACTIFAYRLQ